MANFLIIFAADNHDINIVKDMAKQKKKQNTDIKEDNMSEMVDNQQVATENSQTEEITEEEKETKSEKMFFS